MAVRWIQRGSEVALIAAAWVVAAYGFPPPLMLGVAILLMGVALLVWSARQRHRREKLQAELDETRRRLAWSVAVLEPIEEGLLALDLEGRPSYANRRLWEMLGRPSRRVQSMQAAELLGEEAGRSFTAAVRAAVADGQIAESLEWKLERDDGSTVSVVCALRPIESGGLRLGWLAAFRDISQQRRAESSGRVLAERLEFLFREMPLACVMWDLDFRVAEWNSTAEKIFGWSEPEAAGNSYADLLALTRDDEMTAAWAQVCDGQGPRSSQCRHRNRNDTTVDVEWFHTALLDESGNVVGVASMGHDITRRLLLEQELAQAQKMEAVGSLAGGIAHDFNNLLTAILGNLALLQFQVGPSHPAAKGLRDGVQAAERAAELTQQLLRFSRRSACSLTPVNLAKRLEEVVQLFQMGVESRLELRCSVDEDLWLTAADETQIAQVVMNLLVNARDALPDEGVIEVSARNRELTSTERSSRGWAAGSRYVEIEVWDNGSGIDESIRDRIFEPFFTTKPVGKGTGLGLATAYGIVKRHRGGLEVESRPGMGTTFRLLLPRYDDADDHPTAARGGRVLLVEPDALLAKNAAIALESAGHTILAAATQAEGIELLREEAAGLSLAVLALRLPDGGGGRLIAEARELRPELPLLVTSEKIFEAWSEPGSALLKRPYTGGELAAAVRSSLAASAEAPAAPAATP